MWAVSALLILMFFMWGAAIWATFIDDEEPVGEPNQEGRESQKPFKTESRRDVA
jgi:hypothetical protein